MDDAAETLSQTFRGAVHYGVGVVAGAMCLYNLGRCTSGTGRLVHWANTVIYGTLTVLEGVQVFTHLNGRSHG